MGDIINRLINRWFSELSGNYHLPYFAKVIKVADDRLNSVFCDEENPHYSVDVKILDARLRPDSRFPVFTSVPVTLQNAGNYRGSLGLPRKGVIVEIAFAGGLPNHPFIRSVLPHGLTVPSLEGDETRWNQSESVHQRADKDGNWQRTTNKNITDSADNIYQQIDKVSQSVAKENQRIMVEDGGKVWLGNESTNTLTLLSELMSVVKNLADHVAIHSHSGVLSGGATSGQPVTSATFTADGSESGQLKNTLDSIKE